MCIRIHTSIHAHKHRCKHTSLQTHTQTCIHTPSSSVSVCDWLVLIPCPAARPMSLKLLPIIPQTVVFLPAQSRVGQQGQTTFKDNSVPPPPSVFPPLYHPLFVCISMENEQEREPVQVPSPSRTCSSIRLSVPSSPILYPNRQTDVLALLQF